MFNKNKERRRKRQAQIRRDREARKRYNAPEQDPMMSNKKRLEMRRAARAYRQYGDV